MKACVLEAVGELRLKEVPTPKPKKGEVLLRVRACGICSSDIDRIFKTGTYHFPTIPGHEIAGEIVEVGENVDKALLNRRAVVFPLLPCFRCRSCLAGKYARCDHYNYFGSRCDGGFAEYLAVPIWNLKLFPNHLPFSVAAICEPASVALHALDMAQMSPGDTIAIVGSGTIGILAAMWANICGAGRVILIGRNSEKLICAQSFCTCETINIYEHEPSEYVFETTQGIGADISMEFVGTSEGVSTVISTTKKGGIVVLTGNPAGKICLERSVYWKILRNEINMRGTWNSEYSSARNDWDEALNYMSNGQLDPKALISSFMPIYNFQLAFEMLRSRKDIIKIVFDLS